MRQVSAFLQLIFAPYKERRTIFFALSLLLAASSALLIARKSLSPGIFEALNPDFIYFCFFSLAAALVAAIACFAPDFKTSTLLEALLLFTFPTQLVLVLGLDSAAHMPIIFFLLKGTWLIALGLLLISKRTYPLSQEHFSFKLWLKRQGASHLILVLLLTISFAALGTRDLGRFAAVDEPLWVHGRIGNFWKNVSEKDWGDTAVSDKPGITVALISGIGLLWEDPSAYKSRTSDKILQEVEPLNKAMRLPLLLFASLSIAFFYFILERLSGKNTAIFATSFISLSPVLLGMSRIVNPDALLWVFAPLAAFAFLAYLRRRSPSLLYLSALAMGLALLTKYVSNIIFIFLFGALLLEYALAHHRFRQKSLSFYLKEAILDFATFAFLSLTVFYILLPASWLENGRLLKATLFSQAFATTWPLFVSLLVAVATDFLFTKGKFSGLILSKLAANRLLLTKAVSAIFLLAISFTLLNTYLSMAFYDFESILSSPKSSYRDVGIMGLFAANFYPLVFAISPLALLGLIWSCLHLLRPRKTSLLGPRSRAVFYSASFIVLYYLGSSVTEVASTVRYQIIVFPFAFLLGASGLELLLGATFPKKKKMFIFSAYLLSLGLGTVAFLFHPFYLAYASKLLPQKNIVDVKDMGLGSYEAAEYLNSLPASEELSIWTDKEGVCDFFRGKCHSFNDSASFKSTPLNYFVISSGRKSRSLGLFSSRHSNPYDFSRIYSSEKYEKQIVIGNRPSAHVRIIPNSEELLKK